MSAVATARGREAGHEPDGVTTAPDRMTLAPSLTPAGEFQAFCARGHRWIPSTGECSTLLELQPDLDDVRVFQAVSGPCEELP